MGLLHFFNEHSFLIVGPIVLVILASVLHRHKTRRGWLIWIAAVVVFGAAWLWLRTGSGLQFNSVADYEAALSAGKPTLVEFYSDY